MSNVMIDLETMGTGPNAPVVAIGMYVVETAEVFGRSVSLGHEMAAGAMPDASTILWWLKQDRQAQDMTFGNPNMPDAVLDQVTAFIKSQEQPCYVIGNGSDFDITILTQMYKRWNRTPPWKYSHVRCYRTVKALFPFIPEPVRQSAKHTALADATHQGLHYKAILEYINGHTPPK
jgi:hypothetical protein